ncbi:hypothetical protein A3C09_04935 [Candidatus Uhrbacteria bacterium RIFCSPHIGHO2_02_FULL_47_44]|uniref:Uncharacterized protein n=1 Tax=Candidatus Uhrbacteria bacterium RIFCSPLOWO2_02_FULL_48_18 TaxID=1802408 RepID=A0A1F7V8J8_9BACT|nr:MAG: hypothetical protein A2839_04690 [Candidatus Uhrbacteria bacterium RIFCSPHIGHO2_01_FULL_47_10]OGL70705.1 MAG: hypothetical protein A3C09_04935 [Candidatus Uhrbacteria bacterium RIFCSPHIGHO2_02_FULL_47_44]OGL77782.1 MAG: hypothetical protein A3E97_00980 [Candidatus Uhrbacteria bacterium RIFCSPHIGHO2_12_FULL_47_12]OGL82280.1 MAG: hypothetical protein A3B20_00820 [Candidatus Uhrbacteria bacterium RIFCSPLOWO2_01_FULL_47_17]OGL86771.1 MAG: hypothetical protein A3I41_05540 [Candidatus Uhrbact
MRKQAVTLETISNTLVCIQENAVKVQKTLADMQVSIDSRFDKMDRRFDLLESNVEDNTTSIQYLIRDGIMRVECEEMIDRKLREQLEPMESRILSAFDHFLGQHTMLKEEVISNRYRLGVIEKTMGLSNAL